MAGQIAQVNGVQVSTAQRVSALFCFHQQIWEQSSLDPIWPTSGPDLAWIWLRSAKPALLVFHLTRDKAVSTHQKGERHLFSFLFSSSNPFCQQVSRWRRLWCMLHPQTNRFSRGNLSSRPFSSRGHCLMKHHCIPRQRMMRALDAAKARN